MQAIQNIDALYYDQRHQLLNASLSFTFTPGSGYTSAPTVTFSGGGGTGAAGTAIVTNGRITGINITNGGTGYTSAPTIAFTGGNGAGAAATAILTGAAVSSATIQVGGTGLFITVTDNTNYGTDARAAVNLIVADRIKTVKNYHMGDHTQANTITVDLLADGFNTSMGLAMSATVTSEARISKDGSVYHVGNALTSGNFLMDL